MQPEPYSAANAASDEDNWSWLVTFSDLVLQLFGFAIIAAFASSATHGVTQFVPVTSAPLVATVAAPAARVEVAPDPQRAIAAAEPELALPAIRIAGADEDALPRPVLDAADVLPATVKTIAEPVPAAIALLAAPHALAARDTRIAALGRYIEHLVAMQPELAATVASGDQEVVVKIGDVAGFQPGSADPAPAMRPLLDELRTLVAESPDLQVEVSGHTDDVPIKTAQFPSNLELSLARASRVAHELAGTDKKLGTRISAAGFAEQRPVASNGDPQGRARNRRVEIRLARAS